MIFDFLTRLPLPDYRAALTAGVLLGTALALWTGHRNGLPVMVVVDGVLAAAVGGLLLGRLGYVAAHLPYFREHPTAALALWQGGFSAPGVVVGGAVGAGVMARLRKLPPGLLWGTLAPGAAVVLIAAYLGCLRAGCACGRETWPGDGPLWALSAELPDLYGLRAPRVAVPVLGMGWGALMLVLTLWMVRGGRTTASGATTPGVTARGATARATPRSPRPRRASARGGFSPRGVAPTGPIWLALYGLGEFALGFLRGDAPPLIGGLSALQWAGLGILGAGIALTIDHRRRTTDHGRQTTDHYH
jgi:prolipoprotein diacylglyceryltransferase